MSEVFLLFTDHYEDERIVGVYETKEKALIALAAQDPCSYGFAFCDDQKHCGFVDRYEVL